MGSDNIPVAQAVSSPSHFSPTVMAVAVPAPDPDPSFQQIHFNEDSISAAASSIIKAHIRKEMNVAFKNEHKKNADLLSSFRVTLAREVGEDVSRDCASFLKGYVEEELPGLIGARADLLFPRFLADNSAVKRCVTPDRLPACLPFLPLTHSVACSSPKY